MTRNNYLCVVPVSGRGAHGCQHLQGTAPDLIDVARGVVGEGLRPAAGPIMLHAAAERSGRMELGVKQPDTPLHASAPGFEEFLFLWSIDRLFSAGACGRNHPHALLEQGLADESK